MAKKAARKTQPQPVQQEQQPVAVAEPQPQEPEKWTLPKVCMGQIIVFYPRSTINERNATMAHVMRVHERSIEVAFRGQGYSEVLHKDDDRFITNPDLRMDVDGVWDFTQERNTLDSRLDDIESRIKNLEGK